jgi:hypothetical protein
VSEHLDPCVVECILLSPLAMRLSQLPSMEKDEAVLKVACCKGTDGQM